MIGLRVQEDIVFLLNDIVVATDGKVQRRDVTL